MLIISAKGIIQTSEGGGLTIMIVGLHTVLDSRLPARALVVNAIETEVDDSSIVKRGRAQASVA